jgi:hypothetical protein
VCGLFEPDCKTRTWDEKLVTEALLTFRATAKALAETCYFSIPLSSELLPAQHGTGGCAGTAILRFGILQSTTHLPPVCLALGLGGDTSQRIIAFRGRIDS